MELLRREGALFGFSATATRDNLDTITSDENVPRPFDLVCRRCRAENEVLCEPGRHFIHAAKYVGTRRGCQFSFRSRRSSPSSKRGRRAPAARRVEVAEDGSWDGLPPQ